MAACIDSSRCQEAARSGILERDRCSISGPLRRLVVLCRPSSSSVASCQPVHLVGTDEAEDDLWLTIREEAVCDIKQEPILFTYYHSLILLHNSLERALANYLAIKLSNSSVCSDALFQVFSSVFGEDDEMRRAIRDDLNAARERDPACISYVHCFLHLKGFQAIQAHRAAHKLWSQGRTAMALLIQSRVSEVFAVDIHPGAKMGRGTLLDHATGVVIGETAAIGDNVTILHNVTLGSTGKASGDRHPKIGDWALLGAGAKVLGNIKIGEGARIGAGSVVLKEVPPKCTAVGNPARLVERKGSPVI